MPAINTVNDMNNLNQIDLNLFVVFDTIYDERNLTRAAERLAITQPAVSNALARLRRSLNDPLFVKAAGGMQPTALADSIADRVSTALQGLQSASWQSTDFSPLTSRRIFRISLMDLHDSMILPDLMRILQDEAPGVELRITRVARSDLPKALALGSVDIASDIPLPDTSNLVSQMVARETYVCIMRPDHPLKGQELTLEAYLGLTHLHVSARPQGVGAVDIALRKHGAKRRFGLRMQSYLSAAEIVRNSDMAVTLTKRWAKGLNLLAFPLPIAVPPMGIRLYRHVRTDGDPALGWLFDKIAICTARAE